MINFTTATIGKTTKIFKNPSATSAKTYIFKYLSAFAMLMVLGVNGMMGQVSYTSGTYSQNFDGLAATSGTGITWTNNSTLTGWYLFNSASASITSYGAETGSSGQTTFNSYGATSGGTERALGGQASGGTYWGSPTSGSIAGWSAVQISNGSGGTLNSITIGFDGEQWRKMDNASAHTMVLEYGFGSTFAGVSTWTAPGSTFDWASPVTGATGTAAVNGNVAGLVSGRGGTITGLTWTTSQTLWIRWVERNDAGNDHALAIDNFTFSASASATPPTLTAAGSATVDAPFNVTFPDDPAWRAAITSITVGGTTLTAGSAVTAGQITFTPSASAPASLLQSSGSKSIVVIATGYSNATVTQSIGVGVATKLGITTQPTAPASNGGALASQPVVAIQDQYNNTTTSTATVAAAVGAGTWTLGGTTSVAAVSGTTTYSGLTATSVASVTGATIAFSSTGLTGVTSGSFDIPAPPVAPTVTSPTSASIVNTTAILGGNVTSNGGATITARGVVWSVNATNSNPTIGGGGVTNVVGTGTTGVFTINANGLPPNTLISYRAYATNSVGTTYTTATTFTTLSVATKLVFGTAPASTGNAGVNLTTFTVQAQRADNSIDAEYTANVSLVRNIVSGSAALVGTTSVAAVAGTATFSAAQFNAVGTYTITASSAALTTATSSNIVVSLVIYKEDFGTTLNTTLPYSYGTSSTGSASLNSNLTTPSWSQSLPNAQLAGNTDGAMTASNISSTYTVTCNTIVASGYQMNPTSISFDSRITSTGPTTLNVSISGTGGGSTSISSYTLDRGNTYVNVPSQSFTNTSLNLTGTVTLTFSYSGSGGGNARLDNVILSGNVVCIPATASVLSTTTPAICNGGTAGKIKVNIIGGTSPYSVVYNDGTSNTTQNSYTSGSDISLTPTIPTTYSLVSVTDANSCISIGLSGTPTITPVSDALNATLASGNINAVEQCTDGAGWTYFANSSNPAQLLFGIKKNGNTMSTNVDITVGSPFSNQSSNGTNEEHGMFLMGRSWNATLTSGSIVTPVDVRFFYDPAELTAASTARDVAKVALPGSSFAVSSLSSDIWFKSVGTPFTTTGIIGNKFPYTIQKFTSPTVSTLNGVTYVELTGITSFSGGTGGFSFGPANGGANGLPVTWGDLKVTTNELGNELKWTTESEKNSSHFIIEYSYDGINFKQIAERIVAAGESNHTLNYSFSHREFSPITYYRILQVDKDSKFDRSKTLVAKRNAESAFDLKVYPIAMNGTDELTIDVNTTETSPLNIVLIDMQGREIYNASVSSENPTKIDLSTFEKGMYQLIVLCGNYREVRRIVR